MTECYFNNIDYYIKKYLSKAQTSVCIVVAWINTSLFEAEFSQLVQKNVQITIMYNDDFINAKIVKKQAGIIYIPIRMPSSKNKMHDKFCIIDGRFVISGSYNWSKNAKANFENVIINDDRLTVAKFQNEFYELTNVNSLYEDAKDNGKCINCGHKTFRLGVIQNIDEEKCLDRVDIFEVCSFDTGHNRFLKDEYYQGLTNFLNKDEKQPDYFDEEYIDGTATEENVALNNLAENRQNYELLSFFNHNNEWNIHFHALAYRICDNYSAYIEGYEPLMHFIYKVIWKNKFLANMIEDEYEEIGCW